MTPDVDSDPVVAWRAMVAAAERSGDREFAERLRQGGPPPEPGTSPLLVSPFILAVEVGADPGGPLAVALAARYAERLVLVITSGEAEAARFVRHLLDLLDRTDVAVARASGQPAPGAFEGLTPSHVVTPARDVVAAVRSITTGYPYHVRWANHGPLDDLAAVLDDDPALPDRLAATVHIGRLGSGPVSGAGFIGRLRTPSPAHHDPAAARRAPYPPTLVTAAPVLTASAPLVERLSASDATAWAGPLARHLRRWFDRPQETVSLAPALTVAAAMLRPLVGFEDATVTVDDGGVRAAPAGQTVQLASPVRDDALVDWVTRVLSA
jgi:hypothetical protein